MAITAADVDAIFDGASAVVDATQNIVGAVSSGVNQVQNAFDNSRRNMGPNNANNGGYPSGYGYPQPMNYGYGYAEPTYPQSYVPMMNGINPPQFQMPNSYGAPSYQMGQSLQPQMQPTYPAMAGYYGFSDPGYGTSGYPFGGNNMPGGGQRGGYGW